MERIGKDEDCKKKEADSGKATGAASRFSNLMQPLSKGDMLFDVGHPLEEAVPTDFAVKESVVGIE